ncbi:MAG: anti-sigma factor antagonist [Candidatus Doudnabacteria bacterium CG10_big_fil_rev_8_21_14_0_10_42_18]|uniref:Anti-sigma factor antagonist n=1 Tax=Candidatus Doudnabacteria bacterium CG10_big_fil_rev_8_21_14_0_10_42_18 TaxID=1974552 RepID=A0A2H0VBI3_9BACT|nr:MAG: anti-sigma factor antagonist [Candidatus Doudnabacteria bacterium CG10_big_fil_rev_8_21_14_0_10_42_18]
MSIKLTVRKVGDVKILDADGRITLGEGATDFRDKIHDLVAAGGIKILVNMTGITYADSSGIGELVSAFTTVSNARGALKLLSSYKTQPIRALLITKLYTVFEVYDDEATAVGSFAEDDR